MSTRATRAHAAEQAPLVHALSRTIKRLSIRHQVETGVPFKADRNLRMDMAIERRGLRDATSSECRNKATLLDITRAGPQERVHMRAGSADREGSAASIS